MRVLLITAAFVALVDLFNVLTVLHDVARRGDTLAAWKPITWEATSGVAELIACPIIYATLLAAPPGRRPWGRIVFIHGAASLAFSALHVGLMMGLRIAIYAAAGFHYRVETGAGLYEYRKDILAYFVLGGFFYLFARRDFAPSLDSSPPARPLPTKTFDIVEGACTFRVPVSQIVAVRSADNYAEFHLDDGRRPLMRTTLRDLETRLTPLGFERTHRSWLINSRLVQNLKPSGSGDYNVELAGGVEAPLSRRFPLALERLRNRDGQGDEAAPPTLA